MHSYGLSAKGMHQEQQQYFPASIAIELSLLQKDYNTEHPYR